MLLSRSKVSSNCITIVIEQIVNLQLREIRLLILVLYSVSKSKIELFEGFSRSNRIRLKHI
jgi:hypothetical protein